MSATVEYVYADHVEKHKQFLLDEIRRIEQQAQSELEQSRLPLPWSVIAAKQRETVRQTKPLYDELTRLISHSVPERIIVNGILASNANHNSAKDLP